MPAGLIPNEALAVTLQELLGVVATNPIPWMLVLWKNNIEPDADTVWADLEECDFGGYVRGTLSRSEWTEPVVADGCAHSTCGVEPMEWNVTSGPTQTVYGYAFLDNTMGVLRFVQRFDDADIEPLAVPGTVSMLPEYTYTSHECE